jgi:hypothetical protein
MPHWEEELHTLLESLGVTLEDGQMPLRRDVIPRPDSDDAPPDSMVREWEHQQDDAPPDTEDEFAVINREMEATLQEVTRLVRSGRMEPALRDDVVHVLRALTRTLPSEASDAEEWRYTSAAAVLHFCRLVLRLAHALAHQE